MDWRNQLRRYIRIKTVRGAIGCASPTEQCGREFGGTLYSGSGWEHRPNTQYTCTVYCQQKDDTDLFVKRKMRIVDL